MKIFERIAALIRNKLNEMTARLNFIDPSGLPVLHYFGTDTNGITGHYPVPGGKISTSYTGPFDPATSTVDLLHNRSWQLVILVPVTADETTFGVYVDGNHVGDVITSSEIVVTGSYSEMGSVVTIVNESLTGVKPISLYAQSVN